MATRKGKTKTLTKIDPDTLGLKAYSFSQHATATGRRSTRATTSINPTVRNAPAPPPEPVVFNPNPSNFVGDSSADEDDSEGASREYYIARVCFFYSLSASTHLGARTIHSCYGRSTPAMDDSRTGDVP